jgi:polysaccharide export outer membrane protein
MPLMRNEGAVMKTLTTMLLSLVVLSTAAPAAAQQGSGAAARSNAAAGVNVPPDYRLVVGDKLRIEVYKDPQLSQSLQIRPDGKITLPLVGDVMASGQTPLALRDSIATSLKEYVTNPVVTVIVVETQPQTFSVMGEVNNPGVHPFKGMVTMLDALAMAGGFKDFANTKNIIIQRSTNTGLQRIPFNYKDAVKRDSKPVLVQAGDIIIVP